MTSTVARINRIGTANPPFEVHDAFLRFVASELPDERTRHVFERMAARSGIERRFSFLQPVVQEDGTVVETGGFYGNGPWPSTGTRMKRYERDAPRLALEAIAALDGDIGKAGITHLIVASCTGFMAPGLDQVIMAEAGLDPGVERTVVGFMGCYAAVNSLRLAHHIVRSEPAARVLVVTIELCSIHFQRNHDLPSLLAMLLFGDGAAAALVTAEPGGIALHDFRAATIPGTADAITWNIRDQGFDMHLGGEVPARIAAALAADAMRNDGHGLLRGQSPEDFALWAVHAGGRTILDAVEHGFALGPEALAPSRSILRDRGNMSSATLMFILAKMLADEARGPGMALAFGPGMAAESFRFTIED
ncbi:putative naringenin-chalcone synthase [Novosphingobium sp. PhB165]|uniref:type III polyketide synthase n=1 Tax=Novosphingobium sp. PhB165 TaxID=2485105 RepID=UPI00104C1769|nr:type III polyketide synthase [Novosphingobium sp. PhB165]TCM16428.1 putative naringenin-chalcone synthase [Novosphingobium sp. PhB165]